MQITDEIRAVTCHARPLHACYLFVVVFFLIAPTTDIFYLLASLLNAAVQRALGHVLERPIRTRMRDGRWRVCLQYVAK